MSIIGKTLAHYQITRQLHGRGGAGEETVFHLFYPQNTFPFNHRVEKEDRPWKYLNITRLSQQN